MLMKTLALCALGSTLLLGGCAYDEGYHHHHDYVSVDADYDGYYDDFYGPVADGYWGEDNFFYYTDAPGHPYRRDTDHHFRHDNGGNGFHTIHGHHIGIRP